VIDIAARIPQLANWRDLQTELRHLPDGWSREGDPARLCVIEPESGLPGSLLAIDPEITDELLKRGEADAWRGLERAGWIEPDDSPGERDTSEPSTRRESKEAPHATRAARAPER
jgi:hypothetical protein